MAIPLIVNGVTFQYPQQFDKNWGPTLTNWSSAVTSGMLQKAGGSFPLTAEVDFGSSFGMKVKSIKSEETNIAQSGFLRLANASAGIAWRNATNGADLALTVNASNQLTFNGTSIGATTSLTNGHILVGNVSNQPADVAMSGDITITNAGVTALGTGKVLDANVNASAAIAWSKLATGTAYNWLTLNASGVIVGTAVTASRAVVTDSNGLPTASAATATEVGQLSGVTSPIQTQINGKLSKSGDTMSGVLNMGSNKIQSLTAGASSGEAVAYQQLAPGKIVQTNTVSSSVNDSTTNAFFTASSLTLSFTALYATSLIRVSASFTGGSNSTAGAEFALGYAGSAQNTGVRLQLPGAGSIFVPVHIHATFSPGVTTPLTYQIFLKALGGTAFLGQALTAVLTVDEIAQ